jgi:PHD/YefM family antitoxin component YafN of YafNO toxin-antitoxin module
MTTVDFNSFKDNQDDYDSLKETLAIQTNSYLMDKINAGRKEVANNQLSQHKLIDPDHNA